MIIEIAARGILIVFFSWLQIQDADVICLFLFIIFAGHMIIGVKRTHFMIHLYFFVSGFAVYSWMMYLGNVLLLLSSYHFEAIKSAITKCVNFDERGKVVGLILCLQNLTPLIMTQVCTYVDAYELILIKY